MSISLDENKKGLGLLGSFCRREFPLYLRLPPADFLFGKFVQFVLLYFCTSEVLLYFRSTGSVRTARLERFPTMASAARLAALLQVTCEIFQDSGQLPSSGIFDYRSFVHCNHGQVE